MLKCRENHFRLLGHWTSLEMASTIESIKNSEDSFQQMLTTFNLKNSSNVNYDYVDFKLKKVREWMMDVLFENEGEHSFDELRQNLYVLGMSGHVATVRDDLQNYLSLCLQEELKRDRETWDFCPLDAFTNMWAVHRVKLKKILTICEQTDQHFCNLTNAESINVLYKKRLRKFLLENNLVLFIRNVMIDVYTLLRKNPDQKKINLLKRSTRTIVEIGNGDHQFFTEVFENAFLEKMQTLIGKMIGEVSNSGKGTCKTLKMIQEKMFNEGKLVSEAFGKETAERMAKVYAKIINENRRFLCFLLSDLSKCLKRSMMNEMSELYSFFTGIESLSFFVDETGKKLREIGQEEMRECLNNPINFIRKLLEVKENCERMCATSFAGDRKFVARLNEEFEVLVNRCRQVAEYFAVYLDFLLKSSAGGNLPLEVNSCTFLFRFIHEKDVFERIYKKSLAKRLLSGTSTCYELEKAVVTKLRTECGFQFTQKMEHMLRDVETWQKMNDEYSEHCKLHSQIRNIKFNIRVATAGVWPLYTDDYVLSPQLSPIFQEFSNFYTSKHKGRKLTLCRSAGYASLLANFEPEVGESRQKTISTSTLQMLVLLQFNLKNNWTFKELLESTKMSVKDLGRNLVALTCKGQNVLISSSKKSTDFDANDVFSVNEQFQSSSDVVKVAAVAAYHQSDKAADTREKTEIDRKFEVEACIVRLMKRNRKMNHDELIANVLEEMKDRCGVIGTSTVKQRIEALIEREFIARDSSEFKVYCYVE